MNQSDPITEAIISIDVALVCGHTQTINQGASALDFPEEGTHCDKCERTVPLLTEASAACDVCQNVAASQAMLDTYKDPGANPFYCKVHNPIQTKKGH